MRVIKMFGLAMVAAVAVMAFAGAGTASAQHALLGSVLCHLGVGEQGLCPANSLPYSEEILTLGTSLFLGGASFHISCNTVMHATLTAGGLENHPEGLINSVLFSECEDKVNCPHGVKAVASNLPWLATALGSATLGDGILHVNKHEKALGPPAGLFTCHTLFFGIPVLVECHYEVKEALAKLDGHTATPTDSKLLAEEIVLTEQEPKSGACPDTAKWDYLATIDPKDLTIHLL